MVASIAAALCTTIFVFGQVPSEVDAADTVRVSVKEASAAGDRVSLTATVPSKTAVGHPVPMKVVIRNTSDENVTYATANRLYNVELVVKDHRDEMVPLTRWGIGRLQREGKPRARFVTEVLAPGKELVVAENLGRYFDLSMTGTYTVFIVWHSRVTDEVNPQTLDRVETKLEFEVVEDLPDATQEEAGDVEIGIFRPKQSTAKEGVFLFVPVEP